VRPDLFGAPATHSGDALFNVAHRKDFGRIARVLRDSYDGSAEKVLAYIEYRYPLALAWLAERLSP
jgi:hypothetical protein